MRTVSKWVLCAMASASCATVSTPGASASTTVEPSAVVATYNDRVIRQAEVDAKAADELQKLEEQLFDLRAETAERIALEALVAQAAKKAGLSEEAWLEGQLDRDQPKVTDEQMKALFEKAKGRLPPGVGFDDVKGQLRQAIEREGKNKRAREIFEQLKKGGNYVLVLKSPARPRKNVEALGPSRGADSTAKITLIEFADFQCPYCAKVLETVESVMAAYPGKIRLVFRHYPLSFHDKAPKAAEAAACADEQGQFWKFHDALFASQELEVDAMKLQAQQLGLDAKKFDSCLDSGRMASVVKKDMAAGQSAGVSGTPAFFINGVMLSGAQPEEAFRKIIDQELAE